MMSWRDSLSTSWISLFLALSLAALGCREEEPDTAQTDEQIADGVQKSDRTPQAQENFFEDGEEVQPLEEHCEAELDLCFGEAEENEELLERCFELIEECDESEPWPEDPCEEELERCLEQAEDDETAERCFEMIEACFEPEP